MPPPPGAEDAAKKVAKRGPKAWPKNGSQPSAVSLGFAPLRNASRSIKAKSDVVVH